MRKLLLLLTIAAITLLLQLLPGSWMTIVDIRPDFVLLGVMLVGRFYGKVWGQCYGFTVGLLVDALGMGSFLGLSALTKTIAGFGAGFLKNQRHRISPFSYHVVSLAILFIHFFVYYFINFRGVEIALQVNLLRYMTPATGYTMILYLLVDYLLPSDLS